jgi:hypothetical protein
VSNVTVTQAIKSFLVSDFLSNMQVGCSKTLLTAFHKSKQCDCMTYSVDDDDHHHHDVSVLTLCV